MESIIRFKNVVGAEELQCSSYSTIGAPNNRNGCLAVAGRRRNGALRRHACGVCGCPPPSFCFSRSAFRVSRFAFRVLLFSFGVLRFSFGVAFLVRHFAFLVWRFAFLLFSFSVSLFSFLVSRFSFGVSRFLFGVSRFACPLHAYKGLLAQTRISAACTSLAALASCSQHERARCARLRGRSSWLVTRRHTSHVTRHTSHVTRHTSRVTRHTAPLALHPSPCAPYNPHPAPHSHSFPVFAEIFQWSPKLYCQLRTKEQSNSMRSLLVNIFKMPQQPCRILLTLCLNNNINLRVIIGLLLQCRKGVKAACEKKGATLEHANNLCRVMLQVLQNPGWLLLTHNASRNAHRNKEDIKRLKTQETFTEGLIPQIPADKPNILSRTRQQQVNPFPQTVTVFLHLIFSQPACCH